MKTAECTGENIKALVEDIMKDFELVMDQIISITTDSAANVEKVSLTLNS